jgi:hypothetical protein
MHIHFIQTSPKSPPLTFRLRHMIHEAKNKSPKIFSLRLKVHITTQAPNLNVVIFIYLVILKY